MPEIETKGRVSILMAVYNAEPFLTEAIESVLGQTYSNWELLCVNDGSTDRSLELLNEFARRDARIQVLDQPNAGAANARNMALAHSVGRYVCVLDADDKLSLDYLAQTTAVACQNPQYDCVIPELYSWNYLDEAQSYSCNEMFQVPEPCDGLLALTLSIPWRIHALALWNGDMVRQIGYRTDGWITSDEVSSRDFFAHCCQVVASSGRYYYRNHPLGITKCRSPRPIEKVLTNIQLGRLIEQYRLPYEQQVRIHTEFFDEMIALICYYYQYEHLFDVQERQKSKAILKQAYYARRMEMVRPQKWKYKLRKLVLGYNYWLCMFLCHSRIHLKTTPTQ